MAEHVSLIIPCSFCHFPYIASAVASVELSELSPTQKIIVTDGFDAPISICRELNALGYEVIRNQRSRGPAGAKNTGLDFLTSDSDYIAFLDADDIMHPKRLSFSIKELEDRALSIVGSQAILFTDSQCDLVNISISGHPKRPIKFEKIVKKDAKNKVVMVYATMILKREIQAAVGFFDENLQRGEDFDYIRRAIKLGITVGNTPSRLYAYRHPKFDNYRQFKSDNSLRTVENHILLRYILNCFYRVINLPLKKGIKREWHDIFQRTSLLLENHGLFKLLLENE